MRTVVCPTSVANRHGVLQEAIVGTPGLIIGCGATIPDERDDEGLVDCPNCGMWFNPDEESSSLRGFLSVVPRPNGRRSK